MATIQITKGMELKSHGFAPWCIGAIGPVMIGPRGPASNFMEVSPSRSLFLPKEKDSEHTNNTITSKDFFLFFDKKDIA